MSNFRFSWKRHGVLLALLLIAGVLFLPPYAGSFIGDDYVQLWRIREFVSDPSGAWAVFEPAWTTWYYRPLQNLWILTNQLLWGYEPQPFYLLQIGVHLLAGVLLYRLARRLDVPVWAAVGGAALLLINGAHQQAVGWIASIAIVLATMLSLLAAVALIRYLEGYGRGWLAAAFVAWLAALAASETAFVLPLILAVLHGRRRPHAETAATAVVVGLVMIGYVAVQVARPNVHLSAGDTTTAALLQALRPDGIARFLGEATGRLLTGRALAIPTPVTIFVGVLAAAGLAAGVLRGPRAVRLGLWWATLQLGFIYGAIWIQDSTVFDSRHLYAAAAGLALAVAGAAAAAVKRTARPRSPARNLQVGLAALLIGFLVLQGVTLRLNQQRWEALAERAQRVEGSLKQRLPVVTTETHLFATRFIYTPPYFAPAAAVWYEKPDLSGGTLADLREYEVLTPNFYLFDQTDENVMYDLMPELRAHQNTILVWQGPPDETLLTTAGGTTALPPDAYTADAIAGPPGDSRLSVRVDARPDATAALGYEVGVPAGASLAFSYRAVSRILFEIRWVGANGTEETLFSDTPRHSTAAWGDVVLDVSHLGGKTGMLWFEVSGEPPRPTVDAFWANPRFVWD